MKLVISSFILKPSKQQTTYSKTSVTLTLAGSTSMSFTTFSFISSQMSFSFPRCPLDDWPDWNKTVLQLRVWTTTEEIFWQIRAAHLPTKRRIQPAAYCHLLQERLDLQVQTCLKALSRQNRTWANMRLVMAGCFLLETKEFRRLWNGASFPQRFARSDNVIISADWL